MLPTVNDRWRAEIRLTAGHWVYTIIAWRDVFETWRQDTGKKRGAGLDIALELTEGLKLLEDALINGNRGAPESREALRDLRERLLAASDSERLEILSSEVAAELFKETAIRDSETRYHRELEVTVERERAAFSAWYEMFPRSQACSPGRHGTFDDVIARLPYVRDLGFDVLYFPPIHPIGHTHRKGKNNALEAAPGEPGSPYAIGSEAGGHEAIHHELGTLEDFQRLIDAAAAVGIEIALDFAIQCSPDHPWIKEHPEWFDWRPDGSLKHAENPPKKYEDIVNVHFYDAAVPALWFAWRDIVLLWVSRGVRIFRVDNPHTKPFPFWEWLIGEVHEHHPEVIFLSEAFTRPKPMRYLAKLGFTQSYTYFTWRTAKQEMIDYILELTRSEARDYMRPNFFTNTPDINPYHLQTGGRPAFRTRLVMAATLVNSYGIYNGFELCEARPIAGREEYLDSEKYEIKAWDWDRPGNIKDDIRMINRLRRDHPALRAYRNIEFYNAWNDHILYYGKRTADRSDFLLIAVNLDPHNPQGAHFEVPLREFGLPDEASIGVEDLLSGRSFRWQGKVQHMWLDPQERPYAIWRLSE
jgi:starch synthase (maltosyl-transferring)